MKTVIVKFRLLPTTYVSTGNKEGNIAVGIPGTPYSFSLGINNGMIVQPDLSLNAGAAFFFGAGVKAYQPVNALGNQPGTSSHSGESACTVSPR